MEPNNNESRLVEALKDRIEYLNEQLAREREARRRADHRLTRLTEANASMAEQIRELTAQERSPQGLRTGAQEPLGAEEEHNDTPRHTWVLPWLGG